eukprot:8541772-Lingulodinium_polyedra.AAC.1
MRSASATGPCCTSGGSRRRSTPRTGRPGGSGSRCARPSRRPRRSAAPPRPQLASRRPWRSAPRAWSPRRATLPRRQ